MYALIISEGETETVIVSDFRWKLEEHAVKIMRKYISSSKELQESVNNPVMIDVMNSNDFETVNDFFNAVAGGSENIVSYRIVQASCMLDS